jgi:hypothetical protein
MSRLCCYLRYLGPISLPTYAPKVEVMLLFTVLGPYHPPHIYSQGRGYAAIYGSWALSASPHMLPKSRLCCYLRYLGPIILPTYTPKVEVMLLFTVSASPHMLPRSRLCCYLRYLGPISLPTYAPKVEVYAAIYGTWALSASPHMLPRSRLCCYLRCLGPISLPTYAPKVEVVQLFTVLGPCQPPHICLQS